MLEQPPGKAAHLPLGAGVRAGAEDDPQAELLRDAAVLGDVGAVLPVELALARLVLVPEEVGADRVEAHRLGHLQAVAPVLLGDARGMDLAAADDEGLVVEEEGGLADGEGVGGLGGTAV